MTNTNLAVIHRKLIHLLTAFLPLAYMYWLNREQMMLLSGLCSIGFLTADLLRFRSEALRSVFNRVFGNLLKEEERNKNFTGATHLFFSATILIIFFEQSIAVPALFILCVSDAGAALAGTLFGKHRLFNKTWEGSLIFFVLTCIIITLFRLGPLPMLFTGIITTVAEVLPLPINDNYTVAITSAMTLFIMM